ncbi:MAG: adenylate kinase [Lachnospiraceae bacterium]|nr:adenylate kinase [Lachnospiraceae bacterium]
MKKIIILGCSGSGKSTLAFQLQEITGLPLIHLDNVWWKPDWTHISRDEFDRKLAAILAGESWIIDGDYSRTYEPRFQACDTVIFLDFSEEDCMKGITERVGKARPDIPWTEQALDPELVEQVRNHRETARPRVYELIEKYPEKQVIILKDRKEAEAWLSALRKPCRK